MHARRKYAIIVPVMDKDFNAIASSIEDTEKHLTSLRKELADTDQWWLANPKITAHFFNGNDEWLQLRNSLDDRLGGSELGTAAGHNKYQSPYAMYCEKIGLVQAKDISDREAVIQGHEFEHKVAERFEKVTGRRVHEESAIFTNEDAPHLKASIDRKVFGEESGLECKTVKDIVMRKFPQGDFPQQYYDQCATYLKVTGLKRWYLAMLVFGTDFKVFLMTTVKEEVDRFNKLTVKFMGTEPFTDEESADWVKNYQFLEAAYYISPEELNGCEAIAANFIGRVAAFYTGDANAWPLEDIDGTKATQSAVKEAYAKSTPESVVTFDEAMGEVGRDQSGAVYDEYKMSDILALCDRRAEIENLVKELEEQKLALENQMANVMKDKEEFLLPRWRVTYKNGSARETANVKAIKEYFSALGKEVPNGMISQTEPKRGIRFWTRSAKSKGKPKKKAD